MFRRVFLFLLTNLLIVVTLGVIANVLGIRPYLNQHGINYYALLGFALLWGMGGAFISLFLSRFIAKTAMGVSLVDERATGHLAAYREMTYRLARKAGLHKMPEVGVFQSKQVNAFATGPSERSSLVAVSSALLEQMSEGEMEAIIGHEISHIKNGDMVTMTLLQGIVNAFVIFLARALAFFVSSLGKDKRGGGMSFYALTFLFEVVFMILGSLVVCAFSRRREFKADAGGARLAGKGNMISALRHLGQLKESSSIVRDERQAAFQALMIRGKKPLLSLFSTHPPLEERIRRLEWL